MIEARGICKAFKSIQALQNVDFKVEPGSICGVLGPNGCGKSTLIKSVLGLVLPDKGEIRVCGERVDQKGQHREHIGYLPQNPDFPSNLRVSELLSLIEDIRGRRASRKEELLQLFELENATARSFGTLSGGTKQKVASVVAFMFDAPVWVLDEPSVGLDPVASARFKDFVRKGAQAGKAIVLVSHLMNEAEQLTDQMVFLHEGRVFRAGAVKSICEEAGARSLEEAIFILMNRSRSDRSPQDSVVGGMHA